MRSPSLHPAPKAWPTTARPAPITGPLAVTGRRRLTALITTPRPAPRRRVLPATRAGSSWLTTVLPSAARPGAPSPIPGTNVILVPRLRKVECPRVISTPVDHKNPRRSHAAHLDAIRTAVRFTRPAPLPPRATARARRLAGEGLAELAGRATLTARSVAGSPMVPPSWTIRPYYPCPDRLATIGRDRANARRLRMEGHRDNLVTARDAAERTRARAVARGDWDWLIAHTPAARLMAGVADACQDARALVTEGRDMHRRAWHAPAPETPDDRAARVREEARALRSIADAADPRKDGRTTSWADVRPSRKAPAA